MWPCGLQGKLHSVVDVLSCANFGPVLFVTLSYYTLKALPVQGPIYGDDYHFQMLLPLSGKRPSDLVRPPPTMP